ncbi:MAG: DUF5615 family PIN-like protein [Polaribacter sp.]|nr:DUF5615 family PIN-like protein [Polaribacter sp.]
MKLLLDENLPKKIKYRFSEQFEVITVPELGLSGVKNGDLLKEMQSRGFTILVTLDKNFSHQQNLEKYQISLLAIYTKHIRYVDLLPFVKKIEDVIVYNLKPGLLIIK